MKKHMVTSGSETEVNKLVSKLSNDVGKGDVSFDALLREWLQANDSKKSVAEVKQLTEEVAGRLDASANEVTRYKWVEPGKIVTEYVAVLQPEGIGTSPDPYDILAAHPSIPYRASHLRNLAASYNLWVKFGGDEGAPKLGIGFFSLVLNSRLDDFKKEEFLRLALEKGWTTRELKAEIEKFLGKGKTGDKSKESAPSDWKGWEDSIARMFAGFSSIRAHSPSVLPPVETIESLKALAGVIAEILNAYGDGREGGAA